MADTLTQTHFDDTIKRLFEKVATRDVLVEIKHKLREVGVGQEKLLISVDNYLRCS